MINAADTFISTDRNKWDLSEHEAVVDVHNQPAATELVIAKRSMS